MSYGIEVFTDTGASIYSLGGGKRHLFWTNDYFEFPQVDHTSSENGKRTFQLPLSVPQGATPVFLMVRSDGAVTVSGRTATLERQAIDRFWVGGQYFPYVKVLVGFYE